MITHYTTAGSLHVSLVCGVNCDSNYGYTTDLYQWTGQCVPNVANKCAYRFLYWALSVQRSLGNNSTCTQGNGAVEIITGRQWIMNRHEEFEWNPDNGPKIPWTIIHIWRCFQSKHSLIYDAHILCLQKFPKLWHLSLNITVRYEGGAYQSHIWFDWLT